MKRQPTEHKLQVALLDYLRIAGRRDLHWFAVPNGGHRHIAEASRLKAEGVRSGTPDLCFMLEGGKVAWLEMKTAKGTLGPAQKAFRDLAQRLGHQWGLARSVDEAIVLLTQWGVLRSAYQRDNNFFSTKHLESIKLNQKEQSSGTQA
jgi:hypothetical protein